MIDSKSEAQKSSLSIDVIIKEGRDLVPKDFSTFSSNSKGSSDPYVRLSIDGVTYGSTRVQKKTLKPKWNYQVPIIELNSEKASQILNGGMGVLKFEVIDSDMFKDDPMGVVNVPLQPFLTKEKDLSLVKGEWYKVEKGEPDDKSYCEDASGELLLKIKVTRFDANSAILY